MRPAIRKRATEFTEDCQHQCHITAEAEDAGIGIRQFIEVNHLVNAMSKKQDSEEDSKAENENRSTLPSAIRWENKIVKHNR